MSLSWTKSSPLIIRDLIFNETRVDRWIWIFVLDFLILTKVQLIERRSFFRVLINIPLFYKSWIVSFWVSYSRSFFNGPYFHSSFCILVEEDISPLFSWLILTGSWVYLIVWFCRFVILYMRYICVFISFLNFTIRITVPSFKNSGFSLKIYTFVVMNSIFYMTYTNQRLICNVSFYNSWTYSYLWWVLLCLFYLSFCFVSNSTRL